MAWTNQAWGIEFSLLTASRIVGASPQRPIRPEQARPHPPFPDTPTSLRTKRPAAQGLLKPPESKAEIATTTGGGPDKYRHLRDVASPTIPRGPTLPFSGHAHLL